MNDTLDVAGAMIGFMIVLLLPNLVTIYCSVYSIIRRIRWSLIVRFGGGLVVSSRPTPFEDCAWDRIWRQIESAEEKGFKSVEMVLCRENGEYVYKVLLKEVRQ